jgi:hypothetical protein
MTDKTNNEEYVHDLTGLEANYKDEDGDKFLIIKMAALMNTQLADHPYFAFHIDGSHSQIEGYISEGGLANYTPLPAARPRKWVTLTTENGDKVRCEFVKTHIGISTGRPAMLIPVLEKGSRIIVYEESAIGIVCYKDLGASFTPIPAKQTAVDMIDEMINDFNKHPDNWVIMTKGKLKALKAVIQEDSD